MKISYVANLNMLSNKCIKNLIPQIISMLETEALPET